MHPFQVLFDDTLSGPQPPTPVALPDDLRQIYGADIQFRRPCLYANFVQSMDGVTVVGDGLQSGSIISGRNPADRFLMGLLRALADAVLVGAGSLRHSPRHRWTPDHVCPAFAEPYRALRQRLQLTPVPRTVVITGRGDIDPDHTGLTDGAMVVTTAAGARRLTGRLPRTCRVVSAASTEHLDLKEVRELLANEGLHVILSESGPTVTGQLLDQDMLDEIFLTISPVVAGSHGTHHTGFAGGVGFLPGSGRWTRLRSARRHESHLFLRYAVGRDR